MNLNKYDSQGFPYTTQEAAERAAALFMPHYLAKSPHKPHNVGRNAAKRAARQIRGVRK